MRRCVLKGLVKIRQAPANRYLYYLTPKGFNEKSRLTAEYFTYSLGFYRTASESIARSLDYAAEHLMNRIVLSGISELAEIAPVRAHDFRIRIIGSFQPNATVDKFIGKPVWTQIDEIQDADATLLTSLDLGRSL